MADIAPSFKKRAKANVRKRPATPDSDSSDTDDQTGTKVKRRKEGLTATAASTQAQDLSKSTKFAADRNATISQNDDATKLSNWYTDAPTKTSIDAPVKAPTDGYKVPKYDDFIQKNPDRQKVGPVKAPTNVRTITVTDYAPDVCKDYKLTGYCGFGDTCKFLHSRDNYKQGWQIDRDWEMASKEKKVVPLTQEEKMLKDIPFKCIICKEDYKRPVVTKCGHYFCEKCAMTRYMKEKITKCANCGVDTQGVFGMAKKLNELLERKKEREEARAKESEEG